MRSSPPQPMRFEDLILNFFSMRNEVRSSTKSKRGQMSDFIKHKSFISGNYALFPSFYTISNQNKFSIMSKKNDYWSGYIFEKTDVFLHPRQRHETEKKALNKCVGVKFCIYNVLLLGVIHKLCSSFFQNFDPSLPPSSLT